MTLLYNKTFGKTGDDRERERERERGRQGEIERQVTFI
jgi:hypothetical protein